MQKITDYMLSIHYGDPYYCDEPELECEECGSTDVEFVADEPDGTGYVICHECERRAEEDEES